MTLSLVGPLTTSVAEVPDTTTAKDSAAKTSTAASASDDKVEISTAAQAKLLKHQGQSVAQIASNLALTTKTVDDYLGITETSVLNSLATLIHVSH